MKRQIGFVVFSFILPAFQIVLFCLGIGRAPYNLKMAVVNNETSTSLPVPLCSELFLAEIDSHIIIRVNYSSMDEAFEDAYNSKVWGVIGIGANFTEDLKKRYGPGNGTVSNATIDGSSIHVWLDMTNAQIYMIIEMTLLSALQQFAHELLTKHVPIINSATANIPIVMEKPIYGDLNPSFTNFMAPGVMISITFFMATGLTALSFVLERKQGLLERSYIVGVKAFEVMTAHMVTQLLVLIVQVTILLVFALAVFNVPYEGPLWLVVLLVLFQGYVGMALGMVISAVCNDENAAIQLSVGSMYPSLLLSGIIWPLEGMPVWLRYIAITLPMTYAAEALRCILAKGWDLTYMPVWRGFLVTIGWGWGLLAVSLIILKYRGL